MGVFKKDNDTNEQAQTQETVEVETSDDRSAYNCPACKGEGLVKNLLCSNCNGTGKVEA